LSNAGTGGYHVRMPAVALLVDVDNILIGLQNARSAAASPAVVATALRDFAADAGRVVALRAYATSHRERADPIKSFDAAGFQVTVIPMDRLARSANMDILMSMEGQELLFTNPEIDTYVIASGDADFRNLADAIRRRGHALIVIAPTIVTSTQLTARATQFVPLEDLLSRDRTKTRPRGIPTTARAESLKAFTTRPWSRFEYPTPPWRHAYARGQSISAGPQKKGPGSHLAAKFCNQGNLRMGQAAYMPGPAGGAEI